MLLTSERLCAKKSKIATRDGVTSVWFLKCDAGILHSGDRRQFHVVEHPALQVQPSAVMLQCTRRRFLRPIDATHAGASDTFSPREGNEMALCEIIGDSAERSALVLPPVMDVRASLVLRRERTRMWSLWIGNRFAVFTQRSCVVRVWLAPHTEPRAAGLFANGQRDSYGTSTSRIARTG